MVSKIPVELSERSQMSFYFVSEVGVDVAVKKTIEKVGPRILKVEGLGYSLNHPDSDQGFKALDLDQLLLVFRAPSAWARIFLF